ncbi:response regulator transcription factor [Mesorhizobium sangaii]|uniref:FixJ family two-component response regulator n=1 Tax=Mesorhizobium sangaii TaxID=505389 RepID=A0A841PRN3_9HYPH|nr:response regulator [Mesorhizobium sangaii]MBB6412809.1 FixJ family two-component response regulator [Mesorhizobium sangaii]
MTRSAMISIVDDDESVRLATASLVRSLGFIAFAFESAEDFLMSSNLETTSCLICDIQMPGMTGIELQDHLIEHGYHIPTILITAFPEERVRKRARETGAIGFFGKPLDSQAMINCIDSALHGAR